MTKEMYFFLGYWKVQRLLYLCLYIVLVRLLLGKGVYLIAEVQAIKKW